MAPLNRTISPTGVLSHHSSLNGARPQQSTSATLPRNFESAVGGGGRNEPIKSTAKLGGRSVDDAGGANSLESEVRQQSYYFDDLSSSEAARRVEESVPGAYLLRRSETHQGSFVLCVNWLGTAVHLRVAVNAGENTCTLCGVRFRSISALVTFFSDTPFPTSPAQAGQIVTLTRAVAKK